MPLRFPLVEDIPLDRSPLTEVICQVRYPAILSIVRGQPVDFQEAVRERFPELGVEQEFHFRVAIGVMPPADAEAAGRTFQFRTAEQDTTVALGAEAYALSTTRYTVWDDFARDLALVHGAAMEVYGLPYAKRIGLRYVNQLDRERTGCDAFEDIVGILRPELTASMTTDAWDRPNELVSQLLLADNGGRLVLRVAARAGNQQDPVILLDFDYFEEGRIALGDLVERCTRYHDVIYRAFRWAVRDEKLALFAPRERKELTDGGSPADRG